MSKISIAIGFVLSCSVHAVLFLPASRQSGEDAAAAAQSEHPQEQAVAVQVVMATEPVVEEKPESEPESQVNPQPQPQIEPESQPVADPFSEPEPALDVVHVPKPALEPADESETQSELAVAEPDEVDEEALPDPQLDPPTAESPAKSVPEAVLETLVAMVDPPAVPPELPQLEATAETIKDEMPTEVSKPEPAEVPPSPVEEASTLPEPVAAHTPKLDAVPLTRPSPSAEPVDDAEPDLESPDLPPPVNPKESGQPHVLVPPGTPSKLPRFLDAPEFPVGHVSRSAETTATRSSSSSEDDHIPMLRIQWRSPQQLTDVAVALRMRIVAVNRANDILGELRGTDPPRLVEFSGRLSRYSNRIRTLPPDFFGPPALWSDHAVAELWILVPTDVDVQMISVQQRAIRENDRPPSSVAVTEGHFERSRGSYRLVIDDVR